MLWIRGMRGNMALFDKSINALKKNKEQEQNQSLMKLIKRVHSVVENTDIEKHRQSQDYSARCWATARKWTSPPWMWRGCTANGCGSTGCI